MPDSVEIIIGDKAVSRWTGYTVESHIYTAAGTFSIDIDPALFSEISAGDRCFIKVNGTTVMNGIVDGRRMPLDKDRLTLSVYGRDLMGLVVDSCIESFVTLKNKKLYDVAEQFLREIDYVKRSSITFVDGADNLDVDQEYVQPIPGMTVFNLLSGIAAARGVHFYMLPDGRIVFGRPKGFGGGSFFVYHTGDGNTNVTDGEFNEDISQRYSKVTVLGQDESTPTTAVSAINKKAVVNDPEFPSFNKPLVVETYTAAKTLEQQGRMIIEQQRLEGWSVDYTVKGLSQRGSVWTTDAICSVDDSRIKLRKECLIYGRTFIGSKKDQHTKITLGKMGVAG